MSGISPGRALEILQQRFETLHLSDSGHHPQGSVELVYPCPVPKTRIY